ncbi:hypothetical protein N8979_00860, partial [bacterium]|nr:hypothetical protein [bacterium]
MCLYITGAGVSADSGIPTFRGHDGFWTIGSRNYTPQEMATRRMYLENPAQFLLWYFKRFAAYRHVRPNAVHGWLAAQCNGGAARLITQNIDGLDGKAGHRDYVAIHGRLDKMTVLHDQAIFDRDPGGASGQTPQTPLIDAPWDRVSAAVNEAVSIPIDDPQNDPQNDKILTAALLDACQITATGPQMGVSLKPYVLLFDEYYTDLYRMTEAEQ